MSNKSALFQCSNTFMTFKALFNFICSISVEVLRILAGSIYIFLIRHILYQ